MPFKKIIGSALFAMLAASSAHAADAIVSQEPVPVAASAFSWEGAYFGGEIGWGWAKSRISDRDHDSFSDTFKANGFLGGLYTGYNFNAGDNFILGAEGNIDYSKLKKSRSYELNNGLESSMKSQLGWNSALRARAGYAIDHAMPYIAGGLALGNIKTSYEGPNSEFSSSTTKAGWTIGGGIDFAATYNLILRAEYRYTDLGKSNIDLGDTTLRNAVKSNDIRIGAAYKF
ncbi:outer membrane protein [Brucella pituitosa]|uniref:outer membrane protein n=1 Tax=Brucella pituitosa TaxID=571256 RepID=UPI0009A1D2A6|nr:outer membrane protein [Brucella pituitosa]